MPLANYDPREIGNPLDKIAKAVDIASTIYGLPIKSAELEKHRAETAKLQQANDQSAREQDPNSPESVQARQNYSALGKYIGNTDFGKKNPGAGEAFSQLGDNPEATAATIKAHADSSPLAKAVISGMTGDMHNSALMAALASRTGIQKDRLEETKSQHSADAGKAFENDPIIKTAKTNLNSLDRSQSILENPNKPVLANDMNLAYTDYINSVASGGAATEGKIHRELPESWATEWNALKSKGGNFDDLRKDATGAKLIGMLKENISKVREDLKNAQSDQAENIYDNYAEHSNDQVRKIAKDKFKKYAPDKHAARFPDEASAHVETESKSVTEGPHGPSVIQNGQTYMWNKKTKAYE